MTRPRRRQLVAALLALGVAPAVRAQGLDLDTPFVTTPDNVVRAMLDLARVAAGDRLVDLGSGDGRIVIAAAQRGATAHGVEIDPRLVTQSRAAALRANVAERATFATEDLFETEFAGASVVTMYLLPDVNAKLAPKLLATLKPGSRIVSHDYGLGDWPHDARRVVEAPDKAVNVEKVSTLLLWIVPALLDGRWQGRADQRALALTVRQRWQVVSGTLTLEARDYRFDEARLDGERFEAIAVDTRGRPVVLSLRHGKEQWEGTLRDDRGVTRSVTLGRPGSIVSH